MDIGCRRLVYRPLLKGLRLTSYGVVQGLLLVVVAAATCYTDHLGFSHTGHTR